MITDLWMCLRDPPPHRPPPGALRTPGGPAWGPDYIHTSERLTGRKTQNRAHPAEEQQTPPGDLSLRGEGGVAMRRAEVIQV